MPPKKGKKGKKGKQEEPEESVKEESSEPTEKEILLQQELDDLNQKLEDLKRRVDELRQENEWLQQEAHKVRIESHEYMSYMEKKTSKRQTTIVSLSDQNQKEIHDLLEQKAQMLSDYEDKKAALRNVLLEKESLLAKTKKELEDLHEYKNLQTEQLQKIKELEKEVMRLRGKHTDAIQELKAKFLKEKNEYKQDSDSKIATMARQANKEALDCLNEHTMRVKLENRELRQSLLALIHKTRALHAHREELEQQRRELLREQQYAEDLKKLRDTRQHKVMKTLGMEEGDGSLQTASSGRPVRS